MTNYSRKKHEIAKGLITLHLLDGKVYFELPVDLINKDMLIGSTVTSISDNGNAVVGSKPTDLLHVVFTRNKTHVQLRQVNTDYITGNTQIDEALRKSTLGAILSNQKIQAYNNDSTAIVFDMSSVFLGDNKKDESLRQKFYLWNVQSYRELSIRLLVHFTNQGFQR